MTSLIEAIITDREGAEPDCMECKFMSVYTTNDGQVFYNCKHERFDTMPATRHWPIDWCAEFEKK